MRRAAIASVFTFGTAAAVLLFSQTTPGATGAAVTLSAATANVAGAPGNVRIEILRWSTDEEREKLMSAWELKSPVSGAGGTGKVARGAAKGATAAGRGRGAPSDGAGSTARPTPEAALASALQATTTVGYLWSSENAGYALRYAARIATPDGQRIILITDRRLGAVNQLWNPTFPGDPSGYEFSVIELRLNAKGEGEGKASLTGKVAPDAAAKIVTLENYDMLPAVFRDVRSHAGAAGKP
jgi:hypothetical protein